VEYKTKRPDIIVYVYGLSLEVFKLKSKVDVLLKGILRKERILDIIRNFTVFQDVKGSTVSIVSGYYKYFAVKAVQKKKGT